MTDRYKPIGNSRYMNVKYRYIHDQITNVILPYNTQDNCFSAEDLEKCHMFSKAFIDEYIEYGLTHSFLANATDTPSLCRIIP